ncbi:retrovirus-related pol polyprotein from transposon TNT 1-94 [Tanacetum coccineum]
MTTTTIGYDLEVAFRKHTCFVRNLEGVNLLSGSRGTNLYSLSIGDMMASSPICLLSKATKTKSWLWHRRLSHLNFGAINHLARHGLVRGLPRLKFEKDHLCFACAMGKSKKQSHKPISEDTNQEKLYLLHMDLCGPMRVASVNGKKYILIIVDDYSRLNATMRNIRIDNGTEFVNQTLRDYYEQAEVVATACYTQNRSIIRRRHGKTPYELLHDRKPDLPHLYVFGAICYPNNNSETLGKLQAKSNIVIFIGYAPKKKAYRIYNRRTRKIIETIHVDFDELTAMAFKQLSSGPGLQCMTPATPSSGLVPNSPPSAPFVPPSRHEWDLVLKLVFDEFFSPPTSVASPVPIKEAPALVESTASPSSTPVDQDAPSLSTSQTTPQSQSQTIPLCAEEESHDLEVAHKSNDPYFGIPIPETVSEESSSLDVIPTNVHSNAPISEHLSKWTKDHPLQNILGDPSRPVSIRLQLHEQALFCYYDAFLTSIEPKTLKKALYGLKQAPCAWYDLLSSFLLSQGFSKGTVDPTLFISIKGKDILLVQIYVDDIFFASTTTKLCDKFSEIMCSKFKMSMMGKISFFLGLQISQSPRGIFLNQSKYALESLKKYGMESCDPVDTPMVEKSKPDEDTQGKAVDPIHYRGMVGTLMYLTSSRPDLVYAVCMCARYQISQLVKEQVRNGSRVELNLSENDTTLKELADEAEESGAALDNSLVPSEKRLKIERCNARIAFSKPQREETYQTTIKKIRNSDAENFKLEKKKFRVDTEVFREILQICPKILNQDFIAPPSEEELVTFIQELGYSGRCNMLSAIHTDQMHQPWRTFAAIINRCISGKTTGLDRLRELRAQILWDMYNKKNVDYVAMLWEDFMYQADNKENIKVPPRKARKYKKVASPLRKLSPVKEAEPVKKGKRVKRPAKKSITAPTAGVAIRDTPGVSVSKKKAPAKADKSKDEGTGTKPGVPNIPIYDFESENESWGDSDEDNDDDSDDDIKGNDDKADSDDDGNSDADNNERTDSDDDDENPSFTLKDYDEEEHEEEYESDDDNENVFEEEDDDMYMDVDNVSQEKSYEQVAKDAHVTLTSSQKTDSSKQSSSVSSDFASKFIILENVSPAVDEVSSMMNVKSL